MRTAIRTALTGAPGVPARVGGVRGYAYPAEALPAVEVSTPDETSQPELATLAGPPLLQRQVEVLVVVYAVGGDDIEDELDDVAAAVESAVAGSATVAALVEAIWPAGGQFDPGEARDQMAARREVRFVASMTAPWLA